MVTRFLTKRDWRVPEFPSHVAVVYSEDHHMLPTAMRYPLRIATETVASTVLMLGRALDAGAKHLANGLIMVDTFNRFCQKSSDR